MWAASPDPDSVRRIGRIIASRAELVLVADTQEAIIGFGSIVPELGELRAIYVRPNFGWRGVGGHILAEFLALAIRHRTSILTMDASLNAAEFHLKHDFSSMGWGEHLLQRGVRMTCIKMQKPLIL
jgi:GNAT superfamily N-acetyltransferase